MDITKLKGIIPENIYLELPSVITKYEINTPLRLAHFLGQCSHESINFTTFKENLNYSSKGLKDTFGKYFPNDLNISYAKKPELIANRVYANRMGNGDEKSGDGYKYSGRGSIQLTGKSNYDAFSKSINEDCVTNPNLIITKYPLSSAAWFFSKSGLNKSADLGITNTIITKVTKVINGGTNGLDDRIIKTNKFYNLLK